MLEVNKNPHFLYVVRIFWDFGIEFYLQIHQRILKKWLIIYNGIEEFYLLSFIKCFLRVEEITNNGVIEVTSELMEYLIKIRKLEAKIHELEEVLCPECKNKFHEIFD